MVKLSFKVEKCCVVLYWKMGCEFCISFIYIYGKGKISLFDYRKFKVSWFKVRESLGFSFSFYLKVWELGKLIV